MSTNQTVAQPIELQYLQTTTITNQSCRRAHVGLGRFLHPTTICTANRRGSGICHEDYGNPLVSTYSTGHARELIGVASWFVPCARGRPDAYVRVHPFVPWIEGIIYK